MTALRTAWGAWSRFWFAPVDARRMALVRIGIGIVLISSQLDMWPDVVWLFGHDGPMPVFALERGMNPPRWSHLDGVTSASGLYAWHAFALAVFVALTLGVQARTMALLAFVLQVSVHHRNPWAQHGGDRMLRLLTLYLCFAPSGAVWSVQQWWRARRAGRSTSDPQTTWVPVVALRLIQIQVCVIYVWTGVAKLYGGRWRDGSALYYALNNAAFQRVPAVIDPLLAEPWVQQVLQLGTWLTLGWELLFTPLVIWRRTRWLALGLGVAIHLGIWATMGIGTFSPGMLAGYLAFVSTESLDRLARRAPR